MARRALSPACLTIVQALERAVPPALADTPQSRIALSGGADSLALAAGLACAVRRSGPLAGVPLTARVIDHGLQPGSAAIAATAARQAEALGIPAEVVRITVTPTGDGVEAAARTARYAALSAGPPALILLGHTRDDQAESVLLGLARGSGPRSLAGMPVRRDCLVRPLLTVPRETTRQACRDWGLTWWEDPANTDPAYARSRLRLALPGLEQALGPGLTEALARTADLCREDADFLDALAAAVPGDPTASTLPVTALTDLPDPIRHRVLLAWLRALGGDAVTRDHVTAVDTLLTRWRGQKAISVPGGAVSRRAGHLYRLPL